jgi:hypothetical protein
MAQHETSGARVSITPEGKRIHVVPVSTETDVAATVPTAPDGTSLVSADYTIRPDGGRDYSFVFESATYGTGGTDAAAEAAGQAAQEPIETHPDFNGVDEAGTVSESDLAEIKRAISDGNAPAFTETGANLTAAQGLYYLLLKGVTHYYTPSGCTYSETTDETTKPDFAELCKIDTPPGDPPDLPAGSNWLQIALGAQKIYNPSTGTPIWRTTRTWLASGPRGWNADWTLYKT